MYRDLEICSFWRGAVNCSAGVHWKIFKSLVVNSNFKSNHYTTTSTWHFSDQKNSHAQDHAKLKIKGDFCFWLLIQKISTVKISDLNWSLFRKLVNKFGQRSWYSETDQNHYFLNLKISFLLGLILVIFDPS